MSDTPHCVFVHSNGRVIHSVRFRAIESKDVGVRQTPYTEAWLNHYRDLDEVEISLYRPCVQDFGVTLDRDTARAMAKALLRFADGEDTIFWPGFIGSVDDDGHERTMEGLR